MPLLHRPALRWGVSLALLLPVIVLYAAEYLRDGFTGFIQYDQPYYLADARKFFDGGFHLLYGNPFSPDPHTPAIYFQIHLFVLGLVQAVTGCDPGLLYVIFGFGAGLLCVRVALALYEEVAGLGTPAQGAGLLLFIWGGGVLALAGLVFHALGGGGFRMTVGDLFLFDPAQGWWFLNLGRNLVFPTEAYYHALALGAVLMAMRNHFRAALWLALILSLSHPFTGLQFLLVLLAWCGWEMGFLKNRTIPFRFPALLLGLLIFHLGYNVFLLNLFPEHRSLFDQWSLSWNEPFLSFLGADVLVGLLAWQALRKWKAPAELLAQPSNRLLLTWFIVSFLLVHHDLLLSPRQPLHFSRGYTWIPLFLLGAQPLLRLLQHCWSLPGRVLRVAAVGFVFLIGLSDNLAWFGIHTLMAVAPRWGIHGLPEDGFCLSSADRHLYAWLMNRPLPHTELLITPKSYSQVVYLAMVYTDYRGWYSHFAATPFAAVRKRELADFFQAGTRPSGWRGRTLFLILPKNADVLNAPGSWAAPIIYENEGYLVRSMLVP